MIHPCWSLQFLNGTKMGPCTLDGFANVLKAPLVGPVGGGRTFIRGGIPPPLEVIR
jgi:hypothetical protein